MVAGEVVLARCMTAGQVPWLQGLLRLVVVEEVEVVLVLWMMVRKEVWVMCEGM